MVWGRRCLSAILLLVLFISACGNLESRNPAETRSTPIRDPIKLIVWHNWVGQDGKAIALRGILEQFRKEHPDIQLIDEGIPTEGMRSRLRAVAAADEMPDLFVMFPGIMTKELVEGDLIQPIDEFLDQHSDWVTNFISGAFDSYTVDGKIYSVPMNLAPTSIIYYNQAIFDRYQVKVPRTWEEFELAIHTFNENGMTPIAIGNKANWLIQSTIFSTIADRFTGTDWFLQAVDQKGASFTDPEFIEALQFLQDLGKLNPFQRGYNTIDENQMAQIYFEGKAAMFINGAWATSNVVQNAPKSVLDQTHVMIFPGIEGGKGNALSTSGVVGTGMGISRKLKGEQREAAFDLLFALSGPEGQRATLASSTLVSYKIEPDPAVAHPLFIELHELMREIKFSPVYDNSLNAAAIEATNSGLQKLLDGTDPEVIAKQIQDAQAGRLGRSE
jgi:raffinose/stachyose/melibiose transport system substrate-binding protein